MINQQVLNQINDQLPPQYQLNHFEFGENKAVTLGSITVNLETYQVDVNYIPYLEAVNQQLPTELKFTIRQTQGETELWIGMHNMRHGLNEKKAFKPETLSFIEQANLYLYPEQKLVVYTNTVDSTDVVDRVRVFPNLFLTNLDGQLLLAKEAVYQNPVDISLKRFDVPLLRHITPPLRLMSQLATGGSETLQQINQEFTKRYEQVLEASLHTTPLVGLPLATSIPLTEDIKLILHSQVRRHLAEVLPFDAQQELDSYWPAHQGAPSTSITAVNYPALYRELTKGILSDASRNKVDYVKILDLVSLLIDSPEDAGVVVQAIMQYGIGLLNLPKPYAQVVEQILQGNLDPSDLFNLGLGVLPTPIGRIIDGVLTFNNGQLSFNPNALLDKGLSLLDTQLPPILKGVLSIDPSGQLNFDIEGLANRGIAQISELLPGPLRGAFNVGLKDGRLDMSFNPEVIIGYGIGELNKVLPEGLKINLLNTDGQITGIKIGPFTINLRTGQVELDPKTRGIRIIQRILGAIRDIAEAPNVVTPTALPLDILQSDGSDNSLETDDAGFIPEINQTDQEVDSGLPFRYRYRNKLDLSKLEVDNGSD